jgi:hypothetical protein
MIRSPIRHDYMSSSLQMKTDESRLTRLRSLLIGPEGFVPGRLSRRGIVIACMVIFLLAFGVRLLQWQNSKREADLSMTGLVARYQKEARFLLDGDFTSFIYGSRTGANPGILFHPPGYAILVAVVGKVTGNTTTAMRILQVLADSLAAVLVFLLAARLLPIGAAIAGGVLVALSPQFAYLSLPLMPDSLSALFVLLSIYLITIALRRPRLLLIIGAGAAVGISCWLRGNALLLTPLLSLSVLGLLPSGKRWRYAIVLFGAFVVVILPMTIRNAVVFHSFVPTALGGGYNLVAGIADYDTENRFGLIGTDVAAVKQEAEMYGRPDYATDLFDPDGILRERLRYRRASSVIRSNKLWFAGVVVRRAGKQLEYEPVPIVSVEPTVQHSIEITSETELAAAIPPEEFLAGAKQVSGQAQLSLAEGGTELRVSGDDSPEGVQLISASIPVQRRSEYLIRVPVRPQRGRMIVRVRSVGDRKVLGSATIPDSIEPDARTTGSLLLVQMPLVSGDTDHLTIEVANADRTGAHPAVAIGQVELFRLGAASFLWTRYPRWLLKVAQKAFRTVYLLPLTLLGIILLAVARRWRVLVMMLVVPVYYLGIHSLIHVEYRYTLAMNYFLLVFAGIALYWIVSRLWEVASSAIGSIRAGGDASSAKQS